MYYYGEDFDKNLNIDDLIIDFVTNMRYKNSDRMELTRKEKMNKNFQQVQGQMQQGQVVNPTIPMNQVKQMNQMSPMNQVTPMNQVKPMEQVNVNHDICEEAQNGWMPYGFENEEEELEMEVQNLKSMMSNKNSAIYPYVCECVDEMDYDGSPIYDECVDKNVLQGMVDKTYKNVCDNIPEINEGNDNMMRNRWGRRDIGKSLIEIMLLNEIFGNRRPRRRNRWKKNMYCNPFLGC